MQHLFSLNGLQRGLRLMLPAALLWLTWALAFVYIKTQTAIPIPPMQLCHVPLYYAQQLMAREIRAHQLEVAAATHTASHTTP